MNTASVRSRIFSMFLTVSLHSGCQPLNRGRIKESKDKTASNLASSDFSTVLAEELRLSINALNSIYFVKSFRWGLKSKLYKISDVQVILQLIVTNPHCERIDQMPHYKLNKKLFFLNYWDCSKSELVHMWKNYFRIHSVSDLIHSKVLFEMFSVGTNYSLLDI